MIEVRILDIAFAGHPSLGTQTPKTMKWVKQWDGIPPVVFFTDRNIPHAGGMPALKKVAWIVEPSHIWTPPLHWAKQHAAYFDYVLTHERWIINQHFKDKGLWYPYGGCWIPIKDQHLNHAKPQMVSIIASKSNSTAGHNIRHAAVEKFKDVLAVYGGGYNPIPLKTEALAPFMFSVVSENGRIDDYFTEKLIDCFRTGCVPIYYGCESIGKYFNLDGIIQFKSIEELAAILPTLSVDMYLSMRHAIEDNFHRADKYTVAEDWIVENYPFLFTP